jgi:hypothetical protein
METNTYLHVEILTLRVLCRNGTLYGDGALDAPAGGLECDHEAIAGSLDRPAAEVLELLAENAIVSAPQRLCGIVTQTLAEGRRADEVGEEDGNGAAECCHRSVSYIW